MSVPVASMPEDLSQAMAAAAARSGDATPLETPRSFIYRGPTRVWKLRKIAGSARHDAAVEEYYRGSAQAHGLYEGVEPFGALCMGRIPAAHFLAEVGRKGPLSPRLMDATADALARYHAGLTAAAEADSAGRLRQWITQSVQRVVGAGLAQNEIIGWVGEALTAMDAVEVLVNERGAAGFVRPTHGNFTLAKLGIWRESVVALAPVSASDRRSLCDTGFELALLLMDLEARNARESACRVLSRYMALTGDLALLRLLPLYMSLRALDEAAVGGAVGAQYITLARGYLRPAPGYLVAVGGLPGVGKSTLARALAGEIGRSPGALVLRSDEIRKRAFKVEPEQPLPASAYDAAADGYVFDLLRRDLETALAAGQAGLRRIGCNGAYIAGGQSAEPGGRALDPDRRHKFRSDGRGGAGGAGSGATAKLKFLC
jgi:hypothetical protein